MNGKTITEILAMSGYASYVWTAFGVTVAVLIILYFKNRRVLKKVLAEQSRLSTDNQ